LEVVTLENLEKTRKEVYDSCSAEKEVIIKNLRNLLHEIKGKDWDDFKQKI